MATEIEKLFALQEIDLQRLRILKDAQRSLKATQMPPKLVELQEQVDSMKADQDTLRTNRHLAEEQVKTVKDKLAANQELLDSGKLTDPKDISEMLTIIEELEHSKASLEERALAALLEFEDNNRVFQPLVDHMKLEISKWEETKDEFRKQRKELVHEMEILNQQRRSHTAAVDGAALKKYEDLLKRKNGIAVTTISNSSCDACFMSLPTSVATAPRQASNSFLHCPSCGRMLLQR